MNNAEENNQIEEESFTKTSNNMEYQISNLKKEFEFQNQQKKKLIMKNIKILNIIVTIFLLLININNKLFQSCKEK